MDDLSFTRHLTFAAPFATAPTPEIYKIAELHDQTRTDAQERMR